MHNFVLIYFPVTYVVHYINTISVNDSVGTFETHISYKNERFTLPIAVELFFNCKRYFSHLTFSFMKKSCIKAIR